MNSDNEFKNKLTITKLHFVYVVIILIFIIVGLIAGKYHCSDELTSLISFAATISSIILAVLAIFITVMSNDSLNNLIERIRIITGQIDPTVNKINDAANKIENSVSNINNLTSNIKESSSNIKETADSFIEKINIIEQNLEAIKGQNKEIINTKIVSGNTIDINDFIDNLNIHLFFLAYTCVKSKKESQRFNLDKIYTLLKANPIYLKGSIDTFLAMGIINYESSYELNYSETYLKVTKVADEIEKINFEKRLALRIDKEEANSRQNFRKNYSETLNEINAYFSKIAE